MKIYEITIKPQSGFGTPLKGDTLFGQFCWQIVYDSKLANKPLDSLISSYNSNPFIIFSSVYPKLKKNNKHYFAFRTPSLPIDELFNLPSDVKEKIRKRKEYKSKEWMLIQEGQNINSFKEVEFLNDGELIDTINANKDEKIAKEISNVKFKRFYVPFSQSHNKINRLTNTTGEEGFAPFVVEQNVFCPLAELVLFVGFDETSLNIEQIMTGLERIGILGFGKDASTGLGKFSLVGYKETDLLKIKNDTHNACYTLSPCVPNKDVFAEMFFTPITRFGKHGDIFAKSGNPFKNPVIMADEGAIFKLKNKEIFNKPYIGTALSGLSKIEPKTVIQGYSLYIPVEVTV
ncbi:MAG: type III-A CRISPR-associated RAMP protein Csm4 [bacterium]